MPKNILSIAGVKASNSLKKNQLPNAAKYCQMLRIPILGLTNKYSRAILLGENMDFYGPESLTMTG